MQDFSINTSTSKNQDRMIPALVFEDNPEDKIYLLLLSFYPDDTSDTATDLIQHWQISAGRQDTYDKLVDLIKHEEIDPNRSFIMAGEYSVEMLSKTSLDAKNNIEFNNSKPITVFRFLKVMQENNKVKADEKFDIDEYDHVDYDHGDLTILET